MNINALEEALKANPDAKLLYTIPSFQNPTGITTSLEKRKKVYELCCKYDIAILEDNPYGELRFAVKMCQLSSRWIQREAVIYAGSFSKVMAPCIPSWFSCVQQVAHRTAYSCKAVHRCTFNCTFPVHL